MERVGASPRKRHNQALACFKFRFVACPQWINRFGCNVLGRANSRGGLMSSRVKLLKSTPGASSMALTFAKNNWPTSTRIRCCEKPAQSLGLTTTLATTNGILKVV
jgi:hypothetical protein